MKYLGGYIKIGDVLMQLDQDHIRNSEQRRNENVL